MPFLIASFLLIIVLRYKDIHFLLDRGDFYIYSVGLLSTSMYIFEDLKDSIRGNINQFIFNTQKYVWFFSAFTYGVLFLTKEDTFGVTVQISINVIRATSLIFFSYALFALLRAFMMQKSYSYKEDADIDLESERNKDVEELKKGLKDNEY